MSGNDGGPLRLGRKIDRRVARTLTALYDALVALILRKDYDLITVEDILAEADVGRSTFYAHFTSKDDLLRSSLERLRALLVEVHATDGSGTTDFSWDFSRALFAHVSEFRDVHFALSGGRGGKIVHNAIGEVLAGLLRDWLPRDAAIPRDLAVHHAVATFITVMTWWLDRHPEMAPGEADALFRTLVADGLSDGRPAG